MHPKALSIAAYRYNLPDARIAKYPLAQRDTSKLLIYKDHTITEDHFGRLAEHLPAQSMMVFNQTKVVHARLPFQKPTGGKIEVFCLEPDGRYADVQTAMTEKGEVYWTCFLGGAGKWKEGQILLLEVNETLTVHAALIHKNTGSYTLRIFWNMPELSFAEILHLAGKVPLPPYLNREAEQEDETSYQTIFAKEEGSVAAPTAALHFTEAILDQLAAKSIATGFVTLHVGAGTFKPVKSDTMEGHEMHAEWIDVSLAFIKGLILQIQTGKPLVAVGTTSCRTLESLYWIGVQLQEGRPVLGQDIAVSQWVPYETNTSLSATEALHILMQYLSDQGLDRLVTKTQIIIAPGYQFKLVDALVTNFHQPESTLLLLVSALIGGDWQKVYDHALDHDFRFLSYGDSSLLWKTS
ncbi:S-adenosylmethionine tRNA ribosyltransferase [Taibaiella sp. KBW10]|uniref:S-adenosylmethionine:tRNA ribosyltransferase-isomerase n=1 Tax=Taibaiella sp. KBW10 TaxID=2153357 RepID=UPI000F5B6536|nr:S-adenosylmethionine:tRNA ribosyltransferase-isomerase [Taibaiella sp. KBW10]RQO32289.1 S-adenosylmethionine tRNA ribosyltransferase [Taibaiella sp. KBW10]